MKHLSLNRNQLKYFVILLMVIDHVAWAFFPLTSLCAQIMHFVGRLTAPVMAYFLVEGYLHTKNVKRYLFRMGIFALISWIPYSLFLCRRWPSANFSVIYTLFLGLLLLVVYDKSKFPTIIKIALMIGIYALSYWGDWSYFLVAFVFIFFVCKDNPKEKWTIYYILATMHFIAHIMSERIYAMYDIGIFLAPILLQFVYNKESGSKSAFHKWFFYIFYPLQFFVILLVKKYI